MTHFNYRNYFGFEFKYFHRMNLFELIIIIKIDRYFGISFEFLTNDKCERALEHFGKLFQN